MTRGDKWKSRPATARYWAFKDEVRWRMKDVSLDAARVVFFIPMPESWSKKKRAAMLGEPHRQKPDLDNLIKALGDALHEDDSHVAEIHARKVWAESGMIAIEPIDDCAE